MAIARLKTFVKGRVLRLRRQMAEKKLLAYVVNDPKDVRYLTGFGGDDSVLVVTAWKQMLVTDSRFSEQIRRECPGLRFFLRQGPMCDAVGEVLYNKLGLPSAKKGGVGLDPDAVTASQFRAYQKLLGKGLTTAQGIIGQLRLTKDDWELAQIRKAIRIAEDGWEKARQEVREGISEQSLRARLEFIMAERGSLRSAFSSIVAFGAHAAQPHAVPGPAKLRKSQGILVDWGATVNGYKSDLTRCGVIGRIRPAFAEAYQRALDAQLAAIQVVKAGVELAEVDVAARKVLSGMLGAYGHGTGHGIGLAVHEAPALSHRSKGVLQAGMVITIEPGVYVPGQFGIRIEDDVLVTERGHVVLSRLAKNLESVAL